MNSHLQQLKPYPFARLREAMQGITPPAHLRILRHKLLKMR